jgi:two-component system, response regulator YesN
MVWEGIFMLKVIIADDEIQIRKGLRIKVDWEEEGFQIIAEASNGKEALEILQTMDVDLMITDMRMPIMDGVELAKRCHQEYPEVKVVVLSGYSDFEYVRSSLKQGVKDYLLKPVAPDELTEALRKIHKEIKDEKKKRGEIAQLNRLVHSQLQEMQEQFLLHLVKEEWLQPPVVKDRLQQLQLEELANDQVKVQFVTVEIRINNDPNRLEELRIPFHLLCKELAKKHEGTYLFNDPSYANMVHFLQLINDQQARSVGDLVQIVQRTIKKYLDLETVIGVGNMVNGLEEFRTGYISSLLAWSQSQLGSKSQVIEQTVKGEEVFDFPPDFEKRLTNAIENTDFPAFKENLLTLLGGTKSQSVLSFSFAANQVLFLLGSLAKKYGGETADIQSTIWNCQQSIWKLNTQEKVIQHLVQLAELIIERVRQARFSNKNLIESIRQYMDQHYASEITLTSLSKLFHINSAYLSETFKSHVGQNFSDYLVTLRMEKAKKLLKDQQLKIIDVANLVGFSNSGYFSTVFKKHCGLTPIEYRNTINP